MTTRFYNIIAQHEDSLDASWVLLDFRPGAEASPRMQSTHAGIIPDRGSIESGAKRAGLFVADEMPQNIITRVVNYGLDTVLFDTHVSPIMVSNLHRTIAPDIRAGIVFGHLI